jgi:branched-chain amino acid transport system substrate-binding protein
LTRLLTIGLILLTAALTPGGAGGARPEPIRIGVLLALSGRDGLYGRMQRRAVELARRMQPRVLGRPVELIVADTESDPETAGREAARLISRHRVAAIVGPTTSAEALKVGPVAGRARVPVISPTATAPGSYGRYLFRVCFSDDDQGRAAARYALDILGARRAAMIIDLDQTYSRTLARAFADEFTRWRAKILWVSIFRGVGLNWTHGAILGRAYFQSGDQDFISQLRAVIMSEPQVIYLPNYAAENALIAIQLRRSRYSGQAIGISLITGDGSHSPKFITRAWKAIQDSRHRRTIIIRVLMTSHFSARVLRTPLARAFVAAFRRDLGQTPSAIEALAADAYFLTRDAIRRARSLSGPRLRRALATTERFAGVTGRLTMTPGGDPEKGVVVLRLFRDKFIPDAYLRP